MKHLLTLTSSIALSLALTPIAFSASSVLKTTTQQASYTLGVDLAKNFSIQGLNIDIKAFTLGLEDAIKNRPLKLSDKEMGQAIDELNKQMLKQQQAKHKVDMQKNTQAGEIFLTANAKKNGVTTLDSGVQYKVITSGKGASPTEEDTIFAHYRGTLIDGTEFDSSYKRGSPLKFKMGNVIKGWGEVLKIMKPGAKWKVVIPANMAYGDKGAGKLIGANSTLIFTIELIQFNSEK